MLKAFSWSRDASGFAQILGPIEHVEAFVLERAGCRRGSYRTDSGRFSSRRIPIALPAVVVIVVAAVAVVIIVVVVISIDFGNRR